MSKIANIFIFDVNLFNLLCQIGLKTLLVFLRITIGKTSRIIQQVMGYIIIGIETVVGMDATINDGRNTGKQFLLTEVAVKLT